MSRASARAIVVLLLAVAVIEGLVPVLVQQGAQWALSQRFGRPVSLKVDSVPRAKMLLGRFDQLQLDITGFRKDGLTLDRLRVRAQAIQLDLPALFLRRQFAVAAPVDLAFAAELGQKRLSEYWAEWVTSMQAGSVELSSDRIAISGVITVVNQSLRVTVEGTPLVITDGSQPRLQVIPVEVLVEGKRLPEPLRSPTLALLKTQSFSVPLDLGIDIEWHDARVTQGLLVLEGTVHRGAHELMLNVP